MINYRMKLAELFFARALSALLFVIEHTSAHGAANDEIQKAAYYCKYNHPIKHHEEYIHTTHSHDPHHIPLSATLNWDYRITGHLFMHVHHKRSNSTSVRKHTPRRPGAKTQQKP